MKPTVYITLLLVASVLVVVVEKMQNQIPVRKLCLCELQMNGQVSQWSNPNI